MYIRLMYPRPPLGLVLRLARRETHESAAGFPAFVVAAAAAGAGVIGDLDVRPAIVWRLWRVCGLIGKRQSQRWRVVASVGLAPYVAQQSHPFCVVADVECRVTEAGAHREAMPRAVTKAERIEDGGQPKVPRRGASLYVRFKLREREGRLMLGGGGVDA